MKKGKFTAFIASIFVITTLGATVVTATNINDNMDYTTLERGCNIEFNNPTSSDVVITETSTSVGLFDYAVYGDNNKVLGAGVSINIPVSSDGIDIVTVPANSKMHVTIKRADGDITFYYKKDSLTSKKIENRALTLRLLNKGDTLGFGNYSDYPVGLYETGYWNDGSTGTFDYTTYDSKGNVVEEKSAQPIYGGEVTKSIATIPAHGGISLDINTAKSTIEMGGPTLAFLPAPVIKVAYTIGNDKYSINSVASEIDPGRGTMPQIIKGRTLIPVSSLITAIKGTSQWEPLTSTVTLSARGKQINLQLGSEDALVTDLSTNEVEHQKLEVGAQSINGRTMVPLRFVSEVLGGVVGWDQATQTITITFK